MKKFKRIVAVCAMAAMTVVGLAACSSKSTTVTGVDAGASFKIGGIGPVTGAAAVYGTAVKQGAQIAVDEINAAGGINGTKIEFKFEDDVNDAEKSVNAYNALKDWGMQVLMGTVTSQPCKAVAALLKDDNMVAVTPSASTTEVLNGNVFQVCFTDPNQGTASAKYIGENKLATKIGVIYDSSDVYSSGIYEKFVAEAKNQNLEVVATQAFTADTKTEFSVQVSECKEKGAELVFLPIYYNEASLILTAAKNASYSPIFFGCDGLDGLLNVEGFDKQLAEGVKLLTPFSADSTDEKTANFVKQYKEKFGETPNQFAADAYDAIYIIKEALSTANISLGTAKSAEVSDVIKHAITSIKVDGTTGKEMSWNEKGEVNKAPMAVTIKDGVYVSK